VELSLLRASRTITARDVAWDVAARACPPTVLGATPTKEWSRDRSCYLCQGFPGIQGTNHKTSESNEWRSQPHSPPLS
jgi:hypothetical protein